MLEFPLLILECLISSCSVGVFFTGYNITKVFSSLWFFKDFVKVSVQFSTSAYGFFACSCVDFTSVCVNFL